MAHGYKIYKHYKKIEMKNSGRFCIGLILMAIISVGCDKNDDESDQEQIKSSTGYFIVNNDSFKISECTLRNIGLDEDFDEECYSYILRFSGKNGSTPMLTGFLYSSQDDGLLSGEYSFRDFDPKDGKIRAFYDCLYWLYFEESQINPFVTSGTFNINRSDKTYEINFQFEDMDNVRVTGYYKGQPNYADFSGYNY